MRKTKNFKILDFKKKKKRRNNTSLNIKKDRKWIVKVPKRRLKIIFAMLN